MKSFLTRTVLGSAVAATALASATPAMADPYRSYHRGNGDATGAAIAGGIIGLALGAIIVSSTQHRDRDRYDSERYYRQRGGYNGYYNDNWRNRDGYRYDNDGRPYGYDRGYNGWNGR